MVIPTDPPEINFGTNNTCVFCGEELNYNIKGPELCPECWIKLIDEDNLLNTDN